MSTVTEKSDWQRLAQDCARVTADFAKCAGDEKSAALEVTLVTALCEAGWGVRENVTRPARHKECLVGEYVCPILVNDNAVITVTDVLPIETLSRERLRHIRESVGLAAAILVSRGGGVIAECDDFTSTTPYHS